VPSQTIVLALVATGLLASASCQTWRATTVAPQQLVTQEHPSVVRLTLENGGVVVLAQPTVRNDSLASAVDPGAGAPLTDIRVLEVRRFSVARSVGLALVVGAIGASWAAMARRTQGGGAEGPPPLPK
jgi:hypothetical protein